MTVTYQKLELLQTIQNLDAVQSEKVLDFIKSELIEFCQDGQYICDEVGDGAELN